MIAREVLAAHLRRRAAARASSAARADPLKRWKLTEEDWRNREKRAAYEEAVEEMLERTDTADAPWDVVEGESKR